MYHFDEIIDRRGTNALNTDGFRQYIFHAGPEKVFPYKDEEFVRMWDLYLCSCAATFHNGVIDLHQILVSKGVNNELTMVRWY